LTDSLLDYLNELEKVDVELKGETVQMPKGQPLLRGFQYLEFQGRDITVTTGPFCWNGDCKSCICDLEVDGQLKPKSFACKFLVESPFRVVRINNNYRYKPPVEESDKDDN